MDSQSKKSLFQTIILTVFGLAALFAIGLFAANKGTSTKKTDELTGTLSIWGTIPSATITTSLENLSRDYPDLQLVYSEQSPETMETQLVEAMANGAGPDIFMITPEMIMRNRQRLLAIPYTSFSDSTFKQTFADQANLFLLPEGVVGFPVFINPLVMYVNNDLLTQNYIVQAPTTWEQLTDMVSQVTRFTETGTIIQTLGALGTYDNITHVKPLIATLLFQAGDPITQILPGSRIISATVNESGESVFNFYTGFSNPQSEFYSWNTGQINDQDMFISGNSAVYFGLANEVQGIREKNPNLNFSVHMVTNTGSFNKNTVYGELTGWGINKMSKNVGLSVQVLQIMSKSEFVTSVLNNSFLAPARRDMLIKLPVDDALRTTIYKSAIISRGFWDPNNDTTSKILQKGLNAVITGETTPVSAYSTWIGEMSNMLTTMQESLQVNSNENQ